jgi:hypothetical protein
MIVCIVLTCITKEQLQLAFGCLAILSTLAVVIATFAIDLYFATTFPDDTKTVQATLNRLMGAQWWSDSKIKQAA